MNLAQKREELTHKTFLLMFRILIIFGAPAAIAYFVGKWIDTTYDMRPYGTLAVLGVAFVTSWALTIRMYLKIDKEFKELQRQEAEEEEQHKQANK